MKKISSELPLSVTFRKTVFSVGGKIVGLLFFFLISISNLHAQLITTDSLTALQLVNLLTGPGVTVTNATFTGSLTAEGSFTANGTNLGINNGVVLGTGDISLGVGPNNSLNAGNDLGLAGDPVLDAIANAPTFDAAILEFDFIPQNDTVSFRYVFASEEYPEFVCSQYNDAFLFQISGPGIVGTQNMALIPGTSIPVTINNVNGGSAGTSSGGGGSCDTSHANYYVDNSNGATLEYDGFTTVLTALAVVVPCQVYHLRIAIADAGDGVYDSGVFFEAGSLSSTPVIYAGVDQNYCSNAVANLGWYPIAGWTYSWSPATGLSNPNIANPVLNYTYNGVGPLVQNYVASATNGTCTLHDTVVVTIYPRPVASFTVQDPLCVGQQGTLTYTGNASATAVYTWTLPGAVVNSGNNQGPFQLTYNAVGDYPINVYVYEAGCTSPTFTDSVHVRLQPVAAIVTPPSACVGDTITVNSTGSNAGASALYSWNFGNGNIVSGSGAGPYQIRVPASGPTNFTLTINEGACVSNVANVPFTANTFPLANVIAPPVLCSGSTDTVSFVGTALATTTYNWTFQNAQTISGNGSGPYIIKWNTPGDQMVNVHVTENGCTTIDTSIVHVDLQPVAAFTNVAQACMYDHVNVAFTGTADANTTYDWTFVNGLPPGGNAAGPFDLYWDRSDTFDLTLITMNGACVDTVIHSIVIHEKPDALFSTNDVCLNDTASMINLSYLPEAVGNNFLWTFGDNSTSTAAAPSHVYAAYGTYNVKLQVTTPNGCMDSLTTPFTVFPLPIAQVSTDTVCFGLPNHFANSSSIPAGSISALSWSRGDSTVASGNQSSYTYAQPGDYTVQLLVESDHGCKDSATSIAKSLALPVAEFNPDFTSGCVPLNVELFDHSTSADDSIAYWTWNYGDGYITNDTFPSHLYSQVGTYSLSLQVISKRGCVDDSILVDYVKVYPIPQAAFSFSPEEADVILANVNFYDNSSPVNQWWWNFGDSTFSVDQNPFHLYDSAGVYQVTLIVTNEFGCVDTTYREIIVNDNFTLWIPNAFTPNGDGKNDVFEVKSENLNDFKMDIFDRWGTLIFSSDNAFKGWNGEIRSRKAQMDTYVYRIEIKDNKLQGHVYVGHVSLIY